MASGFLGGKKIHRAMFEFGTIVQRSMRMKMRRHPTDDPHAPGLGAIAQFFQLASPP